MSLPKLTKGIKKGMESSGFTPPLIFELQDSERKVKVWLG